MPKIKQRRKMGWITLGFHTTMLIVTCGLWTPVFLGARRRRVTITHVPNGLAYPPQAPRSPQSQAGWGQPHSAQPPQGAP